MSSGLILLVEDQEEIRGVMTAFLSLEGFEVVEAGDGRQALHILEKQPNGWAAIITDFQMPHINGGQLLRKVVQRQLSIPILILSTSLTPEDDNVVALRSDVSFSLLTKPYSAKELLDLLQK